FRRCRSKIPFAQPDLRDRYERSRKAPRHAQLSLPKSCQAYSRCRPARPHHHVDRALREFAHHHAKPHARRAFRSRFRFSENGSRRLRASWERQSLAAAGRRRAHWILRGLGAARFARSRPPRQARTARAHDRPSARQIRFLETPARWLTLQATGTRMTAAPRPFETQQGRPKRHRFRDFWQRVTEGIELDVLGRQFLSEAKSSYRVYAKDVDWDEVGNARGPRRIFRTILALFQAMLMKLSPARRV